MNAGSLDWPGVIRLGEARRFGPEAPLEIDLQPGAAVRATIARTLDLVSIERLRAHMRVSAWFDGLSLECRWSAGITQTCGVSLEDFPVEAAGNFLVRVVPAGSAHAISAPMSSSTSPWKSIPSRASRALNSSRRNQQPKSRPSRN